MSDIDHGYDPSKGSLDDYRKKQMAGITQAGFGSKKAADEPGPEPELFIAEVDEDEDADTDLD